MARDNPVLEKVGAYPKNIEISLLTLRSLITEVAKDHNIQDLQEELKWGEPSYRCKHGSTIRFDWKPREPNRYAIYFNCHSRLVETFKELYPHSFRYSGNRAIVFEIGQVLPERELKHCLSLALRYHTLKKLPLLGG